MKYHYFWLDRTEIAINLVVNDITKWEMFRSLITTLISVGIKKFGKLRTKLNVSNDYLIIK